MELDLSKVDNLESLINYFSQKLGWIINFDEDYDINDITYDFDANDLGLKENAFAKISELKQLRPLVDGQEWGIFLVNFDSSHFEVSALRKILSALIPSRRNSNRKVWNNKDLLFLCIWGEKNQKTIGVAYFEDKDIGLPQIKTISCEPQVEDITQINIFEKKLSQLAWPSDPTDLESWHNKWAAAFTVRYRQTIEDAHTLTINLAEEAQNIRNRILSILEVENENGYVHKLYMNFKDNLLNDMTEIQFADMYAQTIVYGLFSARCMYDNKSNFDVTEAVGYIPNTNPFLKRLLQECMGVKELASKLSFDELEINNIVSLLVNTKMDDIVADFNRQTGGGREDPVIHFYEEFLSEYDKSQKVQRGVYYTPQPVVKFIVNGVDYILKHNFGVEDGLASTSEKTVKYMRDSKRRTGGHYRTRVEDKKEVAAIQILDPATGTGTFLRQTILQIYENFCKKRENLSGDKLQEEWNIYVAESLLPRLKGFELMMAPYAVAHMKLSMVLKDTGYRFASDERMKIFLTNTLEKPGEAEGQLSFIFNNPLTVESSAANAVKKSNEINIVMGNPPYSGISANNNEWIASMINDYKYSNGEYFNEKKHWLNDDYVKFIRIAQDYIERYESGIMAYICPHGYIDNPTFRSMRWNLLKCYDEIYILNLHGNSNKKEKCPDGSKDENVFDIQQGVAISFFVKKSKKSSKCKVYYADMYGRRNDKYKWLNTYSFEELEWVKLQPTAPYYLFKPNSLDKNNNYNNGYKLTELFNEYTSGLITGRDSLTIGFSKENLKDKILIFTDLSLNDGYIREIFWPNKKLGKTLPGDTTEWSMSKCREVIRDNEHDKYIRKITYRPFDFRYIYYSPDIIARGKEQTLGGLKKPNIAIISARSNKSGLCDHFYITEDIAEAKCGESTTQSTVFPLFVGEQVKVGGDSNLNKNLAEQIAGKVGLSYTDKKTAVGIENGEIGPYDIIYYTYAIMNSNIYRDTYKEQLAIDFPIIPFPTSKDNLSSLISLGNKIKKAHLMEFKEKVDTCFEYSNDNNVVEKCKFENGSVIINNSQEFSNVTADDWNYTIGGYQVLHKWLKDRKGLNLTSEDITHYEKIIFAIRKSREIMAEIDSIIKKL